LLNFEIYEEHQQICKKKLVLYTWSQILLDQKRWKDALKILNELLLDTGHGFKHQDLGVLLALSCIVLHWIARL
jgi:hypothetical protein